MAATLAPGLAGPDTAARVAPLLQSLNDVFAQFAKGVPAPTVAFTDISKLGGQELDSWKGVIEQAVGVKIELRVSLETNAITLYPLRPHMSPGKSAVETPVAPDNRLRGEEQEGATPASEATTTSASSAKKTASKGRAKSKAPRPKNAFIIYRKEWHPKIVEHFPDLQNNDISVLIGRQWKDEPNEVKDKYRSMAAEEKRQHLIDNPGYLYQPRKPSEKKKRMTKNKLAKLSAVSGDSGHDPMQEIDGVLAAAAADKQITIDTFPAPYRQGFPTITEGQYGQMEFVANGEHEDLLYNQLSAWNASHPVTQHGQAVALMGDASVDGQVQRHLPHYKVPVELTIQDVYKAPENAPAPAPNTAMAAGSISGSAGNTEADRQQTIFDDALISDLFDLEAFDVEFN